MLWNWTYSLKVSSENSEVFGSDFALCMYSYGNMQVTESVAAAVIRQPYKVLHDMHT